MSLLYERGTRTNQEGSEEIEPCLGLWDCVQAHVKQSLFEVPHTGRVIKLSYVETVGRNVVMGGGNYCVLHIIKVDEMHYFPNLFDKVLYMFRGLGWRSG